MKNIDNKRSKSNHNNSYSIYRRLKTLSKTATVLVTASNLKSVYSCRNLGTSGHNSISHPHAQFPRNYNLEDVLVSHYCYRHYNTSCPTCHTHGLLEYSCSFCIENTCEQETCGQQWGWLNQLEECRQTIVITETYNTNLDRLQQLFENLISGINPSIDRTNTLDQIKLNNLNPINSGINSLNLQHNLIETDSKLSILSNLQNSLNKKDIDSLSNLQSEISGSESTRNTNNNNIQQFHHENSSNTVSQNQNIKTQLQIDSDNENQSQSVSQSVSSDQLNLSNLNYNDNKYPSMNLDYRIYCQDPNAELNKATLKCYSQCPPNYNKYGVSCFSQCRLPQKDEFSTYCIEPEVRKPIELFSSCAEDCNENNIRDFCFACPEGMHKKDCQCVRSEKIEFREILERTSSNAIMLLIDE